MNTYKAPLADIRFVLHDVLACEQTFARLGFEDAGRELIDAILDESARFSETVLAPLNRVGDTHGAVYDKESGRVTTPPGFREAYLQFAEAGWTGLESPAGYGGQGMPHTLGTAMKEMVHAANLAWGNFPLLSHGATDALLQHGEEWQKDAFLPPMIAGRWTGTMCLTEPHCGSDLGLLKTRAPTAVTGSPAPRSSSPPASTT